ncbi:helix-turn-helix transcriptional regulator [Bacillus wiedmannii]|uniref:helix-turn-helix transcriptional regulator n=1 Tax=Bacillus wiedmannii TaxID=1890302 RepID=UPI0024ADACEE|nr:helix-turn-helix transcriptional regulator [Bacillus wiedmannii]MDI6675414.1 helix-turn-helix transcriptional regulator [Bacillus wiedmannii]
MDIVNVTNLQKGDLVYLIKNKVKQFRVVRDITQEQLASSVQITRQSLIAIEKNKYNPSLELALKLCEFFNCKVEDLFQLDKTGEEKE